MQETQNENSIQKNRAKYPYSLVWTALPCITSCFPLCGHTGVCTYVFFY